MFTISKKACTRSGKKKFQKNNAILKFTIFMVPEPLAELKKKKKLLH